MKRKTFIAAITISIISAITMTACLGLNNSRDVSNVRALKRITERNPIMTHTFSADPSVLVFNDRVYIYMTADTLEYDSKGEVKSNSYSTINTLRVASSADLVNWVYHEPIKAAGYDGIAKWAGRSWAPAITHKKVNDSDKFFLYFSNNANGVGVLTADSPLGPWKDPLGRALITKQTPNCSDIPWLFDPAVFIDDNGRAYLYFGGGVPEGRASDPGSARVVELGSDMISLVGDPARINIPYFFEAVLMNKFEGRYLLSYCTNWSVTQEDRTRLGIENAVIAVMSSNSPTGPFTLEKTILRNPGVFFGVWGNNHHDIFKFKDQWYLAYHSQILEEEMDIERKGYRCVHIDSIKLNGRMFDSVTGTKRGVAQVGKLDPYLWHQGATSAVCAEMSFGSHLFPDSALPVEYAVAQANGSWLCVMGADFTETGAASVNIFAFSKSKRSGTVEIRLGSPDGETIGVCRVRPAVYEDYTVTLSKTVHGVQDIFFVFDNEFLLGGWQFNK